MTITRLFQSGAESNTSDSEVEFDIQYNIACSTDYPKTGTYSFRFTSTSYLYRVIPATRQARCGQHVCIAVAAATNTGNLISFRANTTRLVGISPKDSSTLSLFVGDVECDTCTLLTPMSDNIHIGLDVKIDLTSGWAVVYIDGIEVMRYEGDTGNADINTFRLGKLTGEGGNVPSYTYMDDIFVDDTTGQGAAAPVPDRRFYPITPNGAGAYNHGIGSDGNSVDNHLLVDDRPHNSDTDYVYMDTLDQKELNLMTTYTPPTGFTFAALIPFVYAKKTDAEVDTQLAPLLYTTSGSDLLGTAQALPTSYGWIWERFTTKPGGGAWDQAGINDVQVGFQGKGTF